MTETEEEIVCNTQVSSTLLKLDLSHVRDLMNGTDTISRDVNLGISYIMIWCHF